jgi:hypothetical protein
VHETTGGIEAAFQHDGVQVRIEPPATKIP